jgi:probable tRNA sulfurtransferase
VAEHPVTKPLLSKIEKDEKKLDDVIDELYKKAVDTVEIINCEPMEVE